MTKFTFNDYGPFRDGEIEVHVGRKNPADNRYGYALSYDFVVKPAGSPDVAGRVGLRLGDTEDIRMYAGHIGYGINEEFRGNHYAAKACNLIRPVALDYGFRTLWITCNPDNFPSRRTCEILGCELVEIVDLPEDNDMYRRGERQKCRYRWDIGE